MLVISNGPMALGWLSRQNIVLALLRSRLRWLRATTMNWAIDWWNIGKAARPVTDALACGSEFSSAKIVSDAALGATNIRKPSFTNAEGSDIRREFLSGVSLTNREARVGHKASGLRLRRLSPIAACRCFVAAA
jgi:hypothetical protein